MLGLGHIKDSYFRKARSQVTDELKMQDLTSYIINKITPFEPRLRVETQLMDMLGFQNSVGTMPIVPKG